MAQDVMKGRKSEILNINGVVCDTGRACGIPTPVNDMIVKIVAGMETGEYKYSTENIKYFRHFI